jgi:hypothetical protein
LQWQCSQTPSRAKETAWDCADSIGIATSSEVGIAATLSAIERKRDGQKKAKHSLRSFAKMGCLRNAH